jgi:hypothetical protein
MAGKTADDRPFPPAVRDVEPSGAAGIRGFARFSVSMDNPVASPNHLTKSA